MIIPALLLITLGIVVILTSSPTLAIQQLIFAAVGCFFYLILYNFDYKILYQYTKHLYFFAILLLIITLVLGIETRGSIRWLPIGPFNLQPSEFAKPVVILTFAKFWSKYPTSWSNIFKSLALLIPISLLIFRQPDLGTALTILFIWLVLLISASISFKKLILLILCSVLLAPILWGSLETYQRGRLVGFLSPNQDPQGIGFHVIQSTIAVGSGQLFGRGLGRGTQSRLQFLPEFRTDFIFAFIAEELGFIGSLIVLVLYSIIFWMLFKVLSKVLDRFGELVVIGVTAMLFFQSTVNIGMNIGLVPITGITLPLLSYGGSSIVTTLMSLGLVSSVSRFGTKKKEAESFRIIDT